MTFMKDNILTLLTNALLGLISFLCTSTFTKMGTIQKDLTDLRVEITRINTTLLTREDVKDIVITELEKRGL